MSDPTTPSGPPLAALWFALLGGPVAWSAHLLGSYPLVSVSCRMGSTALLNVLTVVTAVIAAAAAVTGWWAWRTAIRAGAGSGDRVAPGGGSDGGLDRPVFMALCGLLLGALFTVAILMEGLPPLLQDPCVRGL